MSQKMNRSAKILYMKYKYELKSGECPLDMIMDIHPEMQKETEYWPHDEIRINELKFSSSGACAPIKIDVAIQMLNELKEKGCNYAELFFHDDHMEYEFTGLEVAKADEEMINKFEDERLAKDIVKRKERIADLEKLLEKLNKEQDDLMK